MKKKRGFRKITIDDKIYHWRFSEIIEIRPDGNPNNKLEIDLGYFDVWLYVGDEANRPEDYQPKAVKPAFIKKSIENAINLGWNAEAKNELLKLKYRNNEFKIVKE